MLINQKQLKKVAVETQSGHFLGYISDIELETDTGVIERYYVKSLLSIPGLFKNKLLIHKNQIISFEPGKMVVEDSAIKEKAGSNAFKKVEAVERIEPAITSKLDG
ncbi:MAG: hypothetical protein A2Y82_01110 [Candidatus Buchananbacteria bacterium RBG_13_36_9]|uniref:PRC-barrel domain-containing protein n=1 Tax=Candidatus Buchananbacteria bacterium RBG_13_36_9 TaxID=1797530 RepID=A0A1G1XNS6_9BACT|nr:MAG: hypothetical protein A2Y82_01110 [Candidatus Buchananbacteria bacterium RBG_13_36_9]